MKFPIQRERRNISHERQPSVIQMVVAILKKQGVGLCALLVFPVGNFDSCSRQKGAASNGMVELIDAPYSPILPTLLDNVPYPIEPFPHILLVGRVQVISNYQQSYGRDRQNLSLGFFAKFWDCVRL